MSVGCGWRSAERAVGDCVIVRAGAIWEVIWARRAVAAMLVVLQEEF